MESSSSPSGDVPPAHRLRARLRFRHLELLVALGEHGSLHQASRALAMTQPAASKLLREIEALLGTHLFERSRSGAAATASGAALIGRARLLLGLLDGTREEIAAIEGGAAGRVRLGVAAVAAPVLLPRAARLLAAAAPGVVLSAREGGPEMLGELRRADIDGVIGRIADGEQGDDLAVERLYDEPAVAVVRPDHPLRPRGRQAAHWRQALGHEWVLPPPDSPMLRALRSWLAHNDMAMPRSRFESVSVLANIALVRDSDLLALLPSRVAQHYAELGLVRVLPMALPLTLPSVALIRRRGEVPTPAFDAFLKALRTAAGRLRVPTAAASSRQRPARR